ncbi:MAG TPA: TIGR02530 family flagellar biosynthesis protein [Clostridia bacterium]|nr:TIGR02530 family flagellar biosynthesis protein [Clostridia bacterium]
MSVIYNNKPILPIGRPMPSAKPAEDKNTSKGSSFDAVFQEELSKQSEVKFSKHALERLQSRNIKLSKEDLNKIDNAVNKAAEKGVKETLIIMGNSAFIANVKNKTIITAATEDNLKNNVFTNIDGAVII